MKTRSTVAESPEYQRGVVAERERIAKFLETHSIDWDCSVLVWDGDDYDESYCDGGAEHDEFKENACQRHKLADIVRGKITRRLGT